MKTVLIYVWCMLLLISLVQGQSLKVRVANYPPQYYKDNNGEWTGIDVELVKAIIQEAGMSVEFVEMPWSRALTSIKNGEIDIMCNVSKTDERSEFMQWLGPERFTQMVLIIHKNDKSLKISTLDDVVASVKKTGKKIAALQNAFYGDGMKQRINNDVQFADAFVFVPESQQFLPMLEKGRVLGFIEERSNMMYKIRHDEKYKDFYIHSFIFHKEPVYLGISKKMPDNIFEKLKKAFTKLESRGALEKIRKKW